MSLFTKALRTDGPTDRWTDRPTDRLTDGRTDTPSYRDARTHLKIIRKGRRIDSALRVRDRRIANTSKGFVASSPILANDLLQLPSSLGRWVGQSVGPKKEKKIKNSNLFMGGSTQVSAKDLLHLPSSVGRSVSRPASRSVGRSIGQFCRSHLDLGSCPEPDLLKTIKN